MIAIDEIAKSLHIHIEIDDYRNLKARLAAYLK